MSASRDAAHHDAGLARDLSLFDVVNLVVGTIIGSGIFLVPAEIARAVHTPGWMLAVWIIGGVLTMLGALSLAELGAAMPDAGGIYTFITRGFGRLLGLPLRLDALHGGDVGFDRDARRGVPDLPRRVRAAEPDHREGRGRRRDRAAHLDQHHRRQERRAGRQRPDGGQGRRPRRDGARHLPLARARRATPPRPAAAAVGSGSAGRGRRRARGGALGLRGVARRQLRGRRDRTIRRRTFHAASSAASAS